MNHSRIRVRFAPSPTGPLHMGGVRTALYNYLFAKKHGGDFLLRIEDTDQNRFVPGAEDYIMESLRWCGLNWKEGPDVGGQHAPYRQSERAEIYRTHVMRLVEEGRAYYAFDTPEELDAMRKKLEEEKSPHLQYDSHTRLSMRNSLSLTHDETCEIIESGQAYVIRFLMPDDQEVVVHDLIRGEVRVSSRQLDDKVLFKSDGLPTYHLANVVDDYLMQITHVIRGEEWLPSAPLHCLLYKALGWESSMPSFAHLPLLLKPDGPGKLSKRDGDRLGFPVFPLQWTDPSNGSISKGYRESGYYPEAFVNMLALLGWNPGTSQEIFSIDELIEQFSLERVGKSGARFDPDKARWFNQRYLQSRHPDELADAVLKQALEHGHETDHEKARKIALLLRDRVSFPTELLMEGAFFFKAPEEYDEVFVKKKLKPESPALLEKLYQALNPLHDFSADSCQQAINDFMKSHDIGAGKLMPALRLALVGSGTGPGLAEIMEILGREESLKRIQTAINRLR